MLLLVCAPYERACTSVLQSCCSARLQLYVAMMAQLLCCVAPAVLGLCWPSLHLQWSILSATAVIFCSARQRSAVLLLRVLGALPQCFSSGTVSIFIFSAVNLHCQSSVSKQCCPVFYRAVGRAPVLHCCRLASTALLFCNTWYAAAITLFGLHGCALHAFSSLRRISIAVLPVTGSRVAMVFSSAAAALMFSVSAVQDEAFCKALNVLFCSACLQCDSTLQCRFRGLCRLLQSLPYALLSCAIWLANGWARALTNAQ